MSPQIKEKAIHSTSAFTLIIGVLSALYVVWWLSWDGLVALFGTFVKFSIPLLINSMHVLGGLVVGGVVMAGFVAAAVAIDGFGDKKR